MRHSEVTEPSLLLSAQGGCQVLVVTCLCADTMHVCEGTEGGQRGSGRVRRLSPRGQWAWPVLLPAMPWRDCQASGAFTAPSRVSPALGYLVVPQATVSLRVALVSVSPHLRLPLPWFSPGRSSPRVTPASLPGCGRELSHNCACDAGQRSDPGRGVDSGVGSREGRTCVQKIPRSEKTTHRVGKHIYKSHLIRDFHPDYNSYSSKRDKPKQAKGKSNKYPSSKDDTSGPQITSLLCSIGEIP